MSSKRKNCTPSKPKARAASVSVSPVEKAPRPAKKAKTMATAAASASVAPTGMLPRALPPLSFLGGGVSPTNFGGALPGIGNLQSGLSPLAFAGVQTTTGVGNALPGINFAGGYNPTLNFFTPPAFTFPGSVNVLNATPLEMPPLEPIPFAPAPLQPAPLNPASISFPAFNPARAILVEPAACDDEEDGTTSEDDEAREEMIEKLSEKWDCNAIRRMIQRFLARKTMTQTAFLRKIDVNPKSYRDFMSYKKSYQGSCNQTYDAALWFFHKLAQEEASEKKRNAKKKSSSREASGEAKVTRKEKNTKTQELFDMVNSVTLEEPVYVYDDCDEIRSKILQLIESKAATQAALLRELDVNSNSLRRFLTMKGKREGCSNGVYFRAYCFFEKMRIAQNKPKTGKRLAKEIELPTGYSLERDYNWTICFAECPH